MIHQLWQMVKLFFEYNAAHHALRPKNPEDWIERRKSKYLEGMFAENVMGYSRDEKEKWEPTCVQPKLCLDKSHFQK